MLVIKRLKKKKERNFKNYHPAIETERNIKIFEEIKISSRILRNHYSLESPFANVPWPWTSGLYSCANLYALASASANSANLAALRAATSGVSITVPSSARGAGTKGVGFTLAAKLCCPTKFVFPVYCG